MSGEKELITAHALAEALHLSVETVWRYTREEKIPFIELGNKQYRYRLADVLQALAGAGSVAREAKAEYAPETAKKLTYQDYLLLPEEPGCRFEILEGLLVREPSPNVMHQRISRRLQRLLEDYFAAVDSEGEIFDAPLDVTFHDISVVQPDLLYVSGEQKPIVKEARIDGPPTLVVEIISPSGTRKDRLLKLRIYQKAKVEHYWLVDPQEKTLECFVLREGAYVLVASGMDEEVVEHPEFTGLSVPLSVLWAAPQRHG